MQRPAHSFLAVPGEPGDLRCAFTTRPERWLPNGATAGPGHWTMTVRAGPLSRTVIARVGAPWLVGDTHWRSLSWDPTRVKDSALPVDRFLPSLDGELGLNVSGGRATLVFDARYQPPGGPAGAALDSIALHRVARHTLARVLADIAARLTSEALLADSPANHRDDRVEAELHATRIFGEQT